MAQVVHHKAFVGQLKLPIAANAVACISYAALLLGLLLPWFRSLFAASWPVADGFRLQHRDDGPFALLLGTAWFLWPVWFDVVAGPAVEPLVAATDAAIARVRPNPARQGRLQRMVERLRQRARLFASQLLALPLVWLLAMVPLVGLPLVFLLAAAAAAAVYGELPAAHRELPLAVHLADLRRNWALALGFGIGCQLGLLVPFLNLLLLSPAAAVGAVELHYRFDKTGAGSAPPPAASP